MRRILLQIYLHCVYLSVMALLLAGCNAYAMTWRMGYLVH